MVRERDCPRCDAAGLTLEEVLSLGGDSVVGRWACSACGYRLTRFTPQRALDEVERRDHLVPFRQRLEELRASGR